jgi:phenylpropionate dioxygenase-like ring-hydroxylating dioxygenase large terminal subunit
MEQVFLLNWIWVGHLSGIPNSGDYKCLDIANERAVVLRDKNNEV